MSRYLTPSKISLLILALVYTEGVVPSAQTVAVLSFLVSYINPDVSHSSHASSSEASCVVKVEDFELALSSLPSAIPGRTIWDLFLKKLWSVDCSHALEQLLSNSLSVLCKAREQLQKERNEGLQPELCGRISRTSPLGAFVRRAQLEYTRLQFSDAATLWQRFIIYRRPTRQAFERKNPHDGRSSLDVNLSDLQLDGSHPIAQILYGDSDDGNERNEDSMSTHDVESLMEFQVSELQRRRASIFGRLKPNSTCRIRRPAARRDEIKAGTDFAFGYPNGNSRTLLEVSRLLEGRRLCFRL